MKYVVCGDAAFRRTVSYCDPDYACYLKKGKEASWYRTYDTRNGEECSRRVANCPC